MALESGYKCRAGDFVVTHTSKMQYTVLRRSTQEVQRVFRSQGEALSYAMHRYQLER